MKSYIQKQLGEKIKKYRKIKGFSQEQLAEKIGIATNTLSSIERGNAFMTAQTLEKIIEIFNVKPQDIFTFVDNISEEDKYSYILKKLDFIKTDSDKLQIIYNIMKSFS